jgi:hypothetical protein
LTPRSISSAIFALAALAVLGPSACQHASTPKASAQDTQAKPALPAFALPIPTGRGVDDLARFLAGMPGNAGSSFKELEPAAEWVAHAAQSDAGWKRFLSNRQPLMHEFTKANLSQLPFTHPTLFYPFGGPDIMTAQTFFPAASHYVLVGLEPPGSLPDERLLRESASSYLPGLRGSLGSILNKSFFITKEMDQQLRGQAADGLLPVMLIELVRNGNTVRGLRYIGLDDEGKWTERTAVVKARGKADGVAVEFADAAGAVHTLTYFSLNLANEKYTDNAAFHRHLEKLGPMCAMFKSTSYMPHRPQFELIRGQVLKLASAVVQDDSGIPYRFFEPDWEVKLYGHYEQPYGSFRYLKQDDLREAFTRREQVGELPFSIGYGFGRMKSNLIVARKKS